jgi:hypothetical protein
LGVQDEDGNVARREREPPSRLGDTEGIEMAGPPFPDLATSQASVQESWQLIASLAGMEPQDVAVLTAGTRFTCVVGDDTTLALFSTSMCGGLEGVQFDGPGRVYTRVGGEEELNPTEDRRISSRLGFGILSEETVFL